MAIAEYRVVLKHKESIVKLIQYSSNVLFATELITAVQLSAASTANQPTLIRAVAILNSILAKVESDKFVFYKFAAELKQCKLESVASILESDDFLGNLLPYIWSLIHCLERALSLSLRYNFQFLL